MDINDRLLENIGINDLLKLLISEKQSIIFYVDGLENQLENPINIIWSGFDILGIKNINCVNDLLNYIDSKSEIPEIIGLKNYMNELTIALTSHNSISSQFLPLKINNETKVYSIKISRNINNNRALFYFYRVNDNIDIEKLYLDSYKDSLTGLFNSNALDYHMKLSNEPHYFGFMDLDGFKYFNDTFTHKAGDELLQQIGRKFIEISDKNIVFYRKGGDEFVFMTIDLSYEQVVEKINIIQREINKILFKGFTPSLSIGMVYYDNDYPFSITDALTIADIGMYKSKIAGKNKCTYISKSEALEIYDNMSYILEDCRRKTKRSIK